jgi:ribonuclease HII
LKIGKKRLYRRRKGRLLKKREKNFSIPQGKAMGRKTKNKVAPKPTYVLEKKLRAKGYKYIAGVDEVGMSCIAGPVTSAVVILDPEKPIKGLNDSKLLSPEYRYELFDIIKERALAYSVGSSTVEVINQKNIYWASRDAMLEAISHLDPAPDYLLVDGKQVLKGTSIPQQALVKGDQRCCAIAAASIIAKVTRDRIMEGFHELYPDYGWILNKGYPSPLHRAAIHKYGLTPLHRIHFKGTMKAGGWKSVTLDDNGKVIKI